ncbi:MAG TPA: MotA/TolQ/ExbB proton channel family protein [Polyangiaceae bacterium]|nr:MotA/TolQ/ExbB proton channel family protein [Polyangiaceae bacterium]
MTLSQRLGALTNHGTEWVLWLLVALSILSLGVAIERAVLFWMSRDDVVGLRNRLRQALGRGELAAARRVLDDSPSFEARIARAGLDADSTASAEERMRGEAELARLGMERHLSLLGTLGNNAPFIGLLGTVIGIVRAFRELEHARGQISEGLMTEVGEALVATAVGILIALPAVAFFNLYQRVIRTRLGRAEALVREVLALRKASAVPEAAE